MTSIGNYVFKGCTSLKTIEIPENVTSMGQEVFTNCTSIEKVTIYSKKHCAWRRYI
ncbi:leucine-rich repeat protein [Intestinibacter bartlettii]|uniref:leucine-rich repeat protein n=1 Tax=Intestinibacter bartlettii TaxID=261299 RepID=UPI0039923747